MPDPADPTPVRVVKVGGRCAVLDARGHRLPKTGLMDEDAARALADRVNATWKGAKAERKSKGAPAITREALGAIEEWRPLETGAELASRSFTSPHKHPHFDPAKHARSRTGEFAKQLGSLKPGEHIRTTAGVKVSRDRNGKLLVHQPYMTQEVMAVHTSAIDAAHQALQVHDEVSGHAVRRVDAKGKTVMLHPSKSDARRNLKPGQKVKALQEAAPYREALHPRARGGKFARKFNTAMQAARAAHAEKKPGFMADAEYVDVPLDKTRWPEFEKVQARAFGTEDFVITQKRGKAPDSGSFGPRGHLDLTVGPRGSIDPDRLARALDAFHAYVKKNPDWAMEDGSTGRNQAARSSLEVGLAAFLRGDKLAPDSQAGRALAKLGLHGKLTEALVRLDDELNEAGFGYAVGAGLHGATSSVWNPAEHPRGRGGSFAHTLRMAGPGDELEVNGHHVKAGTFRYTVRSPDGSRRKFKTAEEVARHVGAE